VIALSQHPANFQQAEVSENFLDLIEKTDMNSLEYHVP
jgi:hypothetical protein